MKETVIKDYLQRIFGNSFITCVAISHNINDLSFTNKINFNQKILLCCDIII